MNMKVAGANSIFSLSGTFPVLDRASVPAQSSDCLGLRQK